jgi:hypothetical protein
MTGAALDGSQLNEPGVALVLQALAGFVHCEVLWAAHVCGHRQVVLSASDVVEKYFG